MTGSKIQKQPSRAVLRKRCSENIQQIYRRTAMPKCDFNKLFCNFTETPGCHGCSSVNLLHFSNTFLQKHRWRAASENTPLGSRVSNSCSSKNFGNFFSLTLSWRRQLSYRNQFIDLQSNSVDWFLYDNGLHHERVKRSVILVILVVFAMLQTWKCSMKRHS